jgi:hypothetical protein
MLKRSTKYLQKTIRQPNISKTTADIYSTTENIGDSNDKIYDLGYLQITIMHPKSYSSYKNNVGFHGSKITILIIIRTWIRA